ncbi:AmmeMemoRadiSam system protein A [Pseudodesulfovibrio piezophilus]|uniref:AMMECR1 domain protein n=1 Tax=Pseudodesulfovibrio piezophilus (strain DSM 21447 / JCM 15486 / C1TLV30) TaxID=1322246 RepID=M1WQU0_PSEP2|nr:AmmeMemoRadiSam system protein A [Pseudodesulfovibrio piezophilus]CCH49179.1 AMMECR1 domain protein [Pseudodesulfovibrio piezophilus C1TLV30]
MSDFQFGLTEEEKNYLRGLVGQSITSRLDASKGPSAPPEPPTEKMKEHLGAFVTLKIGRNLRGCIGNVRGSGELFRTVWNMARSAAFEDPRFPPLSEKEFETVAYEVSILSPLDICPDPELVEVGRHGLIMSRGGRSGLLLPQVPVEWNWSRETFLAQTCVKAGLERSAWKDPETTILWFQAVVF